MSIRSRERQEIFDRDRREAAKDLIIDRCSCRTRDEENGRPDFLVDSDALIERDVVPCPKPILSKRQRDFVRAACTAVDNINEPRDERKFVLLYASRRNDR